MSDRLIRAPFAGVVGLRMVSPGALVSPGERHHHARRRRSDQARLHRPRGVAQRALPRARGPRAERRLAGADLPRQRRGDRYARRSAHARGARARADRERGRRTAAGTADERRARAPRAPVAGRARRGAGSRGRARLRVRGRCAGRRPARRGEERRAPSGIVEVREGLAASDRVVVEGTQQVRPGAPVRILGAEPQRDVDL